MLEVRDLHKEYKTKKGVTTKALDGVSLTFPETGLVFILGKSGSGKSTLLNVCGGLDRYDSGEIIIKGKSSKSFSAQDFDSYRNTYVGFIFQEYNILNEFTVEENIALALELQNKKRDKATIERILEDVDMKDFAGRKPNTLSGGQKQRVAIARALVKEPEIIMADEPTGALDSKTGQQVFDTLKKLSKTKLVMVVSHDREFAEQYGDRIIELKDGKVLSDMTRDESVAAERNVRFYGTDTVCIQNGSAITDKDIESIKTFLAKQKGAAVITTSREQIGNVKETMPELEVGEFKNIEGQPKSKDYPEQKLIRSKFPLRHAIRMGAGSIKVKPVRLVFTLLLSIVAFVLFGLASTVMLYDAKSVTAETLMSSDYSYISLGKKYQVLDKGYNGDELQYEDVRDYDTRFTLKEYDEYVKKYPGSLAAFSVNSYYGNISISQQAQDYYGDRPDGIVLAGPALNKIAGEYPIKADEIMISEFMFNLFKLTTTKFNKLDQEGVVSIGSDPTTIINAADPVMLKVIIGDKQFDMKIVGVYKSDPEQRQYDSLKQAAEGNASGSSGDGMAQYQWRYSARPSGLYHYIAVSQKFITDNEKLIKGSSNNYGPGGSGDVYSAYFNSFAGDITLGIPWGSGDKEMPTDASVRMQKMGKYASDFGKELLDIYAPAKDGAKLTSLPANTVAVDAYTVHSIAQMLRSKMYSDENIREKYDAMGDAAKEELKKTYTPAEPVEPKKPDRDQWDEPRPEEFDFDEEAYQAALAKHNADWQEYNEAYNVWWPKHETWESGFSAAFSEYWAERDPFAICSYFEMSYNSDFVYDEELAKKYAEVFFDSLSDFDVSLSGLTLAGTYDNSERTVTVGGVFYDKIAPGSWWSSCMYLPADLYDVFYHKETSGGWHNEYETKYKEDKDAIVSYIFIKYDKSSALTNELVDMTYKVNADDSKVAITNGVMESLNNVHSMMDTMGKVFLYVGIAFAVFSFLMMFNFISASISAKKKDIGILRAIGARSLDVFKIFMSEAMIIALICMAASIGGTIALCIVFNRTLVDTIISAAIFVFGPLSALFIIGLAILTAFVSTIIPVVIYSKKPPVDSIRAL